MASPSRHYLGVQEVAVRGQKKRVAVKLPSCGIMNCNYWRELRKLLRNFVFDDFDEFLPNSLPVLRVLVSQSDKDFTEQF